MTVTNSLDKQGIFVTVIRSRSRCAQPCLSRATRERRF